MKTIISLSFVAAVGMAIHITEDNWELLISGIAAWILYASQFYQYEKLKEYYAQK